MAILAAEAAAVWIVVVGTFVYALRERYNIAWRKGTRTYKTRRGGKEGGREEERRNERGGGAGEGGRTGVWEDVGAAFVAAEKTTTKKKKKANNPMAESTSRLCKDIEEEWAGAEEQRFGRSRVVEDDEGKSAILGTEPSTSLTRSSSSSESLVSTASSRARNVHFNLDANVFHSPVPTLGSSKTDESVFLSLDLSSREEIDDGRGGANGYANRQPWTGPLRMKTFSSGDDDIEEADNEREQEGLVDIELTAADHHHHDDDAEKARTGRGRDAKKTKEWRDMLFGKGFVEGMRKSSVL